MPHRNGQYQNISPQARGRLHAAKPPRKQLKKASNGTCITFSRPHVILTRYVLLKCITFCSKKEGARWLPKQIHKLTYDNIYYIAAMPPPYPAIVAAISLRSSTKNFDQFHFIVHAI